MITEEKINTTLAAKTTILWKRIVEAMPDPPQAIYLVGGYGRGEGAWYEDEEGIHPYNDFDLAVVTEKPLSKENNSKIRKEIAKEVGINWVDIDYYSIKKLKALKPTIHDVDLIEGSTLIYGEDVIKKLGIHVDKTCIGKSDIDRLYATRMWTFLGSWEGPFHDLNTNESRFFKNQMAKATLAACDMRLIKLHKYTSSYCERVRIVTEEFSSITKFCELANWAIQEKTRPSTGLLSSTEMKELYFNVKEIFLQSFVYSYGANARYYINPEKIRFYHYTHTNTLLLHLYAMIKYHNSSVLRGLDVFTAQNYVLLANEQGIINGDMLKKASMLLMKHHYIEEINNSWDEMRLIVSRARNNV